MPQLQRIREFAARAPIAPGRRFARWLEVYPRDDLVRIGSEYGGWTVPESLIEAHWICYCAGVGDDVTFDLGLIERFGCSVWAFDPTPAAAHHVRELQSPDPRFHFVPYGVWSTDQMIPFFRPKEGDSNYSAVNLQGTRSRLSAPVRSLTSLMHELGHNHIDLLKLDVEGAEYEALAPVLAGAVNPSVLCVEFHKTEGLSLMKQTVTRLEQAGYLAVHREDYDVTLIGRGYLDEKRV